ncbi:unnamed protein product [Penicillium camemberti]|uniref:Str. FM013 n=1 Tax=Penicillium camemberti (strain FM 013) TaxID=1429867 RepID=A0A0G4NYD0_PENC3|nr:unnamed protein product [Penicillium camemberti]
MSSKHDPVARADRDNRTEPTEQLHTCVRSTSDVQDPNSLNFQIPSILKRIVGNGTNAKSGT